MNRNAIFEALYARLTAIQGLISSSRRVNYLITVPPSDQPAMAIESIEDAITAEPGRPNRVSLRYNVYVVAFDDGPNGPLPTVRDLIDRIEAALAVQPNETPRSGNHTTLGNTVVAARIYGNIRFNVDPDQSEQGGAVIPVEVVAV
jgi:hypothetical protein